MEEKKKKEKTGYPITIMLLFVIVILLPLLAWRYVDYFDRNLADHLAPLFAVSMGVLAICWLIVFISKFASFCEIEDRTRARRLQNKAKKGRGIKLIQKMVILPNVAFMLSLPMVFLFFLIIFPGGYNEWGFWVVRGVSAILFIYGILFSFPLAKPLLLYKRGKFIVVHQSGRAEIEVDKIIKWELVYPLKANGENDYNLQRRKTRNLLITTEQQKYRIINCDYIGGFEEKMESLMNASAILPQ